MLFPHALDHLTEWIEARMHDVLVQWKTNCLSDPSSISPGRRTASYLEPGLFSVSSKLYRQPFVLFVFQLQVTGCEVEWLENG